MARLYSMSSLQRSFLATMPSTQRVRKRVLALVRSSMLSSKAAARAGIMTLRSRLPFAPHQVTVASLPMTRAQTCMRLSHMTGLTLPGMMELPGWVAGMAISPMAHWGPELSQRMSLAILKRLTAMVLSWPLASTRASLAAWASKWSTASWKGRPVFSASSAMARFGMSGWQFKPVPTAVPPRASSMMALSALWTRLTESSAWRA